VSSGDGTAAVDGSVPGTPGKIISYHHAIHSCRRLFSFSAKRKLGSVRGEGILLYVKPDLYRLEVWDEMGNLLFHYIDNGEEYEYLSAEGSEEVFSIDEHGKEQDFGTGFTLDEIRSIGLCAFDVDPGAGYMQNDRRVATLFLPSGGDSTIEKRLVFESSSGMPSRFLVVGSGKTLREAVFENADMSNGIPRPQKVKIIDHLCSTTVTLTVIQENINAAIPEELFSLEANVLE